MTERQTHAADAADRARALSPESRSLVRAAVRAWRRLTTSGNKRRAGPGEPMVVALSGGADSSGLLVALALGLGPKRAGEKLLAVHVVHDLRPSAEADADARACVDLCGRLGVELVVERVRVRMSDRPSGTGDGTDHATRRPEGQTRACELDPLVDMTNLEARARRLRYEALARVARSRGFGFVATAHHADDQLETMLMRLMRGAGPGGMAGIATVRRLSGKPPVRVIRPFLAVSADGRAKIPAIDGEALRRLCREFGWAWCQDATNADPNQLRAALRMHVLPVLKGLRPGVAGAAARSAGLMREAATLVDECIAALCVSAERGTDERISAAYVLWPRATLRNQPRIVAGGALRSEALALLGGAGRADRLTQRTLGPLLRAIADHDTQRREFELNGVRGIVTTKHVRLEAAVLSGPTAG